MRCLIVEDHPICAMALSLLVRSSFPGALVEVAASQNEARELARSADFDLAILDVFLGETDSLDLLPQLVRNHCPDSLRLLVVSSSDDAQLIEQAKTLGAHGYICKNQGVERIRFAIDTIASGRSYFPATPERMQILSNGRQIIFTRRQQEVIHLLLRGHSNKRIAEILRISGGTVRNHASELMRIANASSRLELVTKLVNRGYTRVVSNRVGLNCMPDPEMASNTDIHRAALSRNR